MIFSKVLLCLIVAVSAAPDRGYDPPQPCGPGQIRKVDGTCGTPKITRNVYAFVAPDLGSPRIITEEAPEPKVNQAVVFLRAPDAPEHPEPLVAPSPQHQTAVYVLSKNNQLIQRVVEAPDSPAAAPQVHYVAFDNENSIEDLSGFEDIDFSGAFNNAQTGRAIGNRGGVNLGSDEARFGAYGLP